VEGSLNPKAAALVMALKQCGLGIKKIDKIGEN
jgi:hypothetical protein